MPTAALITGLLFLDCAIAAPAETAAKFTVEQAYRSGHVSLVLPPPMVWAVDFNAQAMWPISANYPGKKFALSNAAADGEIIGLWPSKERTVESVAYSDRDQMMFITTLNRSDPNLPDDWTWQLRCDTVTIDE